jgi:hypothetical protein
VQVADFLRDEEAMPLAGPAVAAALEDAPAVKNCADTAAAQPAGTPADAIALLDTLSQPAATALLAATNLHLPTLLDVLPTRHHAAAIMAASTPEPTGVAIVTHGPTLGVQCGDAFLKALPSVADMCALWLSEWPLGRQRSCSLLSTALSSLTSLRAVTLSNAQAAWVRLPQLFDSLASVPHLTWLRLSSTAAPPIPARRGFVCKPALRFAALALACLPRLSLLHISNCWDPSPEAELDLPGLLPRLQAPSAASDFAALTQFELEGAELALRSAADTAAICECLFKRLRHARQLGLFSLNGAALGCERFGALAAELPPLTELWHLDLGSNRLKRAGIAHLPALLDAACNHLSVLDLSENSLRDMHEVGLAASLGALTRLVHLSLKNTVLGLCGAEALATALRPLDRLQTLDLRENGIPERGLLALVRTLLPALCALTALRLWGNDQRPSIDAELEAWSKEGAAAAYEPVGGWAESDNDGLEWLLDADEEPDIEIVYADSTSDED